MDNDSKSTFDEAYYWTAYIIAIICACLYCVCTLCIHKNDDIENNAIEIEPRSTTITTTTATAAPQVEGNESELKNQRREYILTNVIWKTVLSTSTLLRHESYSSIRSSNADRDNTSHYSYINSSEISVGQHDCETIAFPIQLPIRSSTLYSPKQCPICLEAYKVGDEIAWSKNDNCHHAFHLDCILDWLMENEQCPMCREAYLVD